MFLPRLARLWRLRRPYSSKTGPGKSGSNSKDDPNAQNGSANAQKSENVARRNDASVFQVKPTSAAAAPAPLGPEHGLDALMKKDTKPYVPRLKHERLTYEYPGLPNNDDFSKHSNKVTKQKVTTRWTRHVPKILTALFVVWGGYTVKVWYFPGEDGAGSTELLDPHEFHKFVVTHKQQVDADHWLVEVRPKHASWQYSYYAHYDNKSIWNGDRIWSVEVKQPQIMVVRLYTPLPLYFMKSEHTRLGEKEPLLRVVDNDLDDYDKGGVMTFYVKRYADGEVSRYIVDKNVGDELDIRGPRVEYKFPHHPLNAFHERPVFRDLPSKVEPENLVAAAKRQHGIPDVDTVDFYAAGTGIAPALQVLFSRNPYRGFINLHYSARTPGELLLLDRFLFFLEKLDRVKVTKHIDAQPKTILSKKDVPKPAPRNYVSAMRHELEGTAPAAKGQDSAEDRLRLRMAILNGEQKEKPDDAVRGPRYETALEQAQATSRERKQPAALAIVCGPDGYMEQVCGGKLLNSNEQGPVGGLLGAQGWDSTNVYKL